LIILPHPSSEEEREYIEGGRHNREPDYGRAGGGVGSTEDSGRELLVADLYVNLGGVVTGGHLDPAIGEWFTVVRGRVGLRIDGRESMAELNQRMHVPPGVAHDWWNAGEEEAYVVIEISPGQSFER
jgi:mannose-6-phosphate isomerase-like protein (cupin superfamily)